MIFFNVKAVRKFLVEHGHVFTLRKPRKRVGKDVAVYGSRYKNKRIGKVLIQPVSDTPICSPQTLLGFVKESGLFHAERGKLCSSMEWLEKAQKMSGNDLRLYLVEMEIQ